jgi:hypothetical protein
MIDELLPAVHHVTEQYANNPVEADHRRLNPDCGRCAA